MLRALGDYTRITVFPTNLHMERNIAVPAMWKPRWTDQLALGALSFLGIAAAVALIIGAVKRGRGRPLRIFGAFWFLCGFLPVSNVVELNATLAEHWLYLPLAGLLLVFVGWLLELPPRGFRVATVFALIAATALGIQSTIRSSDWVEQQVFYERTISAGGWSPRVAVNLAMIYGYQGRLPEARRLLERSLRTWPDYPIARIHLAVILLRQGETAKADEFSAAAATAVREQKAVYARTWTGSIQVARRAVEEKRENDALRVLAEARLLEPSAWPLAKMQAELLRRMHGPEAALPVIQEFADKNWWHYSAFLALGKLRAQQGDSVTAVEVLTHASRLDIRETEALNLIARIQLGAGNLPAAFAVQRRAVSRQPDEPSQHELLSDVLKQMGRTKEAGEARETAVALQRQVQDSA
jgi:Flp pilus assembly protein TadD